MVRSYLSKSASLTYKIMYFRYVLLKERNMLLTMEQECKDQVKLFPSPERLDKVADSMENLEEVVRERNRAYYELETGEIGEQPVKSVTGPFGLPVEYRFVYKGSNLSILILIL